jgi:hypothetical protein
MIGTKKRFSVDGNDFVNHFSDSLLKPFDSIVMMCFTVGCKSATDVAFVMLKSEDSLMFFDSDKSETNRLTRDFIKEFIAQISKSIDVKGIVKQEFRKKSNRDGIPQPFLTKEERFNKKFKRVEELVNPALEREIRKILIYEIRKSIKWLIQHNYLKNTNEKVYSFEYECWMNDLAVCFETNAFGMVCPPKDKFYWDDVDYSISKKPTNVKIQEISINPEKSWFIESKEETTNQCN